MADNVNGLNLSEAIDRFLSGLPPESKMSTQVEVNRFSRWFGGEKPLKALTPAEIAYYAERLSLSDADHVRKLELTRSFLSHARKKGWLGINLAIHLRAKKTRAGKKSLSSRGKMPELVEMTPQGYADLQAELESLKSKRPEIIDEIRRAAADKDFKENVPFHAAREKRSHLEGRIIELEQALNSAVVNDGKKLGSAVCQGDSVVICNIVSGEELCYTLVAPREIDPSRGRISCVSPLGRAVLGKKENDIVEVVTPAGKQRYRVKQIER